MDIQNATVISTPNVHSYSNAKFIKMQVWLKVQLWSTSILQLPHLNNSEQSLVIKCDLQTWLVNTNICYLDLFKYCEGCWVVVGVLEKKSILQVQMIEAANTGQLLLPGEWVMKK